MIGTGKSETSHVLGTGSDNQVSKSRSGRDAPQCARMHGVAEEPPELMLDQCKWQGGERGLFTLDR
jgi:hypothetical protein